MPYQSTQTSIIIEQTLVSTAESALLITTNLHCYRTDTGQQCLTNPHRTETGQQCLTNPHRTDTGQQCLTNPHRTETGQQCLTSEHKPPLWVAPGWPSSTVCVTGSADLGSIVAWPVGRVLGPVVGRLATLYQYSSGYPAKRLSSYWQHLDRLAWCQHTVTG